MKAKILKKVSRHLKEESKHSVGWLTNSDSGE